MIMKNAMKNKWRQGVEGGHPSLTGNPPAPLHLEVTLYPATFNKGSRSINKPLMKNKMHLTEAEKETLDWLKETGWYNWGIGEPYYSDVFGHDMPTNMNKTEEQMDTILSCLYRKNLITWWEHECYDDEKDGWFMGLVITATWRTYDFYDELTDEHIEYHFNGKDPREEDDATPLTHEMRVSPFMEQFEKEMIARQNGEDILSVNGNPMGGAMWNLIISHRDLSLWTGYDPKTEEIRPGGPHIQPNSNWRVKDVKKYFGIKGTSTHDPENPTGNVMYEFLRLYNWIQMKPN